MSHLIIIILLFHTTIFAMHQTPIKKGNLDYLDLPLSQRIKKPLHLKTPAQPQVTLDPAPNATPLIMPFSCSRTLQEDGTLGEITHIRQHSQPLPLKTPNVSKRPQMQALACVSVPFKDSHPDQEQDDTLANTPLSKRIKKLLPLETPTDSKHNQALVCTAFFSETLQQENDDDDDDDALAKTPLSQRIKKSPILETPTQKPVPVFHPASEASRSASFYDRILKEDFEKINFDQIYNASLKIIKNDAQKNFFIKKTKEALIKLTGSQILNFINETKTKNTFRTRELFLILMYTFIPKEKLTAFPEDKIKKLIDCTTPHEIIHSYPESVVFLNADQMIILLASIPSTEEKQILIPLFIDLIKKHPKEKNIKEMMTFISIYSKTNQLSIQRTQLEKILKTHSSVCTFNYLNTYIITPKTDHEISQLSKNRSLFFKENMQPILEETMTIFDVVILAGDIKEKLTDPFLQKIDFKKLNFLLLLLPKKEIKELLLEIEKMNFAQNE